MHRYQLQTMRYWKLFHLWHLCPRLHVGQQRLHRVRCGQLRDVRHWFCQYLSDVQCRLWPYVPGYMCATSHWTHVLLQLHRERDATNWIGGHLGVLKFFRLLGRVWCAVAKHVWSHCLGPSHHELWACHHVYPNQLQRGQLSDLCVSVVVVMCNLQVGVHPGGFRVRLARFIDHRRSDGQGH